MRKRFALTSALLLAPETAPAEFSCQSSITYKWKQEKEEAPKQVFWLGLRTFGATEAEAKGELERRLGLERKKATTACEYRHENTGRCVAAKLSAKATVLREVGFAMRKTLEESMTADCQSQSGRCLGAEPAEIKCEEKVVAVPAEAEGDAAKGKGDKGAKKK